MKYVALLFLVFVGCSDNGSNATTNFRGTYEISAGCSTGVREVNGATNEMLVTNMCEELIDQVSNSSCALQQREQLFIQLQCRQEWPYNTNNNGSFNTHKRSYAFSVNGCKTGEHFFVADSELQMMRMFCKSLRDDSRNRNCASNLRWQFYLDSDCDSYL